jgi:hypothetical protein
MKWMLTSSHKFLFLSPQYLPIIPIYVCHANGFPNNQSLSSIVVMNHQKNNLSREWIVQNHFPYLMPPVCLPASDDEIGFVITIYICPPDGGDGSAAPSLSYLKTPHSTVLHLQIPIRLIAQHVRLQALRPMMLGLPVSIYIRVGPTGNMSTQCWSPKIHRAERDPFWGENSSVETNTYPLDFR